MILLPMCGFLNLHLVTSSVSFCKHGSFNQFIVDQGSFLNLIIAIVLSVAISTFCSNSYIVRVTVYDLFCMLQLHVFIFDHLSMTFSIFEFLDQLCFIPDQLCVFFNQLYA